MDIHKKSITLYIYVNKQNEMLFILSSLVVFQLSMIVLMIYIYISSIIKDIYEMQMKH